MKAVSGKFHPIFQWFYFDSVESLPENLPLPPEEVDLQVGCAQATVRNPCTFIAIAKFSSSVVYQEKQGVCCLSSI